MKKYILGGLALALSLGLSACVHHYQAKSVEVNYLRVAEGTSLPSSHSVDYASPLAKEVEASLQPYKKQLDSEMQKVIGRAPEALDKRQPECTLGNWMADALAERAHKLFPGKSVDLVVLNHGGIRVPALPQGDIRKQNIFELAPFDNTLVHLEVTGAVLLELLQHIRSKGGWPVSAGLSMNLQGELNAKIGGKRIEPDSRYGLVTNDYLADGGDNCAFLVKQPRIETGKLIRDLLIEHILAYPELKARVEGRIVP